jgi:large subunit ribosomal protein L10
MPKTRQQKEDVLKQVVDNLKSAKSAVVSNAAGLKVSDSEQLRKKCRAEKVELVSVKKTILKKAFKDAGLEGLENFDLSGSLLIAFGNEDEVAPAKILKDFGKTHEQIQFRSGLIEGKLVDAAYVQTLADLPSKLELYAKIVGSLNAPISGFVNVMAGNLRGLVNVLSAIKDKKPA